MGKRVGLSSDEKLEKLFGKYDQYFSSKFRKGSQSNDMYLKRYQKLLTMLILSVPKYKVTDYITKYGEVAGLAIEQSGSEKGTDYKELFISEFIYTVKNILKPSKEMNVKTTGIVTDLGDGEREVNEELVDRLNSLFDSVRDAFEDIDDKKEIYERYTRELESFIMNDDDGGIDSIEFSFELEAYLNTFELIDELNGIRLEKDDLSDDEVSESMESLEKDISKLLQYDFDMDEGEDIAEEDEDEGDDFQVEELKEEVKQEETKVTEVEEEPIEIPSEIEEDEEVEDFGNDVQVVVSKRSNLKEEPKEVEVEEDYEEEDLILDEDNGNEDNNEVTEVEIDEEEEESNEEDYLVEAVEDEDEIEEEVGVGSLDDILGDDADEDVEIVDEEDEYEVGTVEDEEEEEEAKEVFDVTQFLKSD